MCGIVGYCGYSKAADILIEGLKRLEYRGYDSAGISLIENKEIEVIRSMGKLRNLEGIVDKEKLTGTVGIGHTRWATHGKVSEENAHPHIDCKNSIILVHNGIIENYDILKKGLLKNHNFSSQTDTEVIVHLIEENYKGNLLKAVQKSLKKLKGSYAIAVMSLYEPDKIIFARNESPLIIGKGENEMFVASDIPAILNYTKNVVYLNDGDIGYITKDDFKVYDLKNLAAQKRKVHKILWSPAQAEKGGYKHFMLKEIYEQPSVFADTIRGRINLETAAVHLAELDIPIARVKKIKRIYITACGTSWHAGLVGKFIIENNAKIPVEVDYASELRYRNMLLDESALVISISQSGETADTLAAVKKAAASGALLISICNVKGSTLTREVNGTIYTHAGPEIGVASTKAFTTQIAALYMLSLYIGKIKGVLKEKELLTHYKCLYKLPNLIKNALKQEEKIKSIAEKYFKMKDFLYLGRGINYPIALEGALKLKEISYIHAEGYPAGEMKHGPIALIDEAMPVVVLAAKSGVYDKVKGNIEEVIARDGIVISIVNPRDKEVKKLSTDYIEVPLCDEMFSPVVNIIPLQLLAYHIAALRGCDIDQPRNLAKSVTVE